MIDNIQFPRVLVISHNVFSKNTSMGKTMDTFFSGWDKSCIAQLFFHSEIPTSDVCLNYYQFTDIDALKSLVNRKHTGRVLKEKDVQLDRADSVNTAGLTNIYNLGRKRLPLMYTLRDYMWKLSSWESQSLTSWLDDFKPEVVFLSSGDYEFSYKIALRIADYYNIPLVTCCFDDYYIYNKNENSVVGRLRHKHYMRTVNEAMRRSSFIFTVNDLMSEAYSALFNKECPVLYTATNIGRSENTQPRAGISYLGGLGLGRDRQLVKIGLTLKSMKEEGIPSFIDVYSGETDPQMLKHMTLENGINYHGNVSQTEVSRIISHSVAVIHTESFDEDIKKRVMYSLSTKIPDSIASGTCLLAYGPPEVASIDYLIRNDAAFVATNEDELKERIRTVFTSKEDRDRITDNAMRLAKRNHDKNVIPEYVRKVLVKAISKQ